MTFEKFEKDSGTRARISLRKSGSIGFNSGTIREYFEDYDYVQLYYDADNKRVGFEPMKRESPDTYTLQKRDGKGQGGSVHAKAFMREYDLIPENTKQYKSHWSDENRLVYIELNNPVLTYDND